MQQGERERDLERERKKEKDKREKSIIENATTKEERENSRKVLYDISIIVLLNIFFR